MALTYRDKGRAFHGSLADVTSTDSYASAGEVPSLGETTFYFTATTNDLHVKILGGYDGFNFPTEDTAQFVLAVGTPQAKIVKGNYAKLQVQVRAAVASNQGVLSTKVTGKSLPASP